MLSKHAIAIFLSLVLSNSTFAQTIKFIQSPTIFISSTVDLKVNQDAHTTLESFARNWSQFEILVNKQHFPIDAPNCKENIQIRFKGIEPVTNQISEVQKSRWELLQRIRNGNYHNTSPILLAIDTTQYIKKSKDGNFALDYCNVFVE